MTLPLNLKPGAEVRVRGRYYRRRVVIRLDREPMLVDASVTSGPAVLLCGWQRTVGPHGHSRRFFARFVEPDEPVEVIEVDAG